MIKYFSWSTIDFPFQVSEEEEYCGHGQSAALSEAVQEVDGRARLHHVVDQEAGNRGGG